MLLYFYARPLSMRTAQLQCKLRNYRNFDFLSFSRVILWRYNSSFWFDIVRIWEFSPLWTDFDKCHNLSKRTVKLILKRFGAFKRLVEPKNVVFNSFECKLGLFWHSWAFIPRYTRVLKWSTRAKKGPIYARTH
jgi:hypothetical protein